ncbi:MAG: type 1 glutamine amidotransferase domain-containing protein [Actinomycetota bacterium]
MGALDGKRVAFLATNGVESSELTEPWKAISSEGAEPELLSIEAGDITGKYDNDLFTATRAVADATADEFDALVLPGGVANPDKLRMHEPAIAFVRAFFEQRKPVAAICHAPWTLIEANVVRDRTMTSYPSLRTDLRNAGAEWVDEAVVVDNGLVTSRSPDDLPAFNAKVIEEIAEGRHEGQRAAS